MKALILSGGRGTRLRPITHTSAKQLVPIANKPILYYAVESVVAAGVTDIGMVVGDTADEIRAAVGDGSRWGVYIHYIIEQAPLGTAGAVLAGLDSLADTFLVLYGDTMVNEDLERIWQARKNLIAKYGSAEAYIDHVIERDAERAKKAKKAPNPNSNAACLLIRPSHETLFAGGTPHPPASFFV